MRAPYFPYPLYHGYYAMAGHLLWYWDPRLGRLETKWPQHVLEKLFYMGGQLCVWDDERPEGLACTCYFENIHMTALAFWDRSRDPGMESTSVFWLPGKVQRRRVIAAARKAFPQIFTRFAFEVRLQSLNAA